MAHRVLFRVKLHHELKREEIDHQRCENAERMHSIEFIFIFQHVCCCFSSYCQGVPPLPLPPCFQQAWGQLLEVLPLSGSCWPLPFLSSLTHEGKQDSIAVINIRPVTCVRANNLDHLSGCLSKMWPYIPPTLCPFLFFGDGRNGVHYLPAWWWLNSAGTHCCIHDTWQTTGCLEETRGFALRWKLVGNPPLWDETHRSVFVFKADARTTIPFALKL